MDLTTNNKLWNYYQIAEPVRISIIKKGTATNS